MGRVSKAGRAGNQLFGRTEGANTSRAPEAVAVAEGHRNSPSCCSNRTGRNNKQRNAYLAQRIGVCVGSEL